MNRFFTVRILVVLSAAIFIVSSSYSFNSLLRDYQQFERLITQDNVSIELPSTLNLEQNISPEPAITRGSAKNWTFIVYMAADNDLRAFAANNIKQMASIGSNQHINIVIHLDIRLNGNKKITRRYYIEKNKLTHMNQEPETQRMDSGDPATLISCCEWAINQFPAQNYALILWNHGTGIIDPRTAKIINPAELFSFNPNTNRLELDRSVGFLDFLYCADLDQRGICWDNTTGNFLTNQNLDTALNTICSNILKKKFSLIGFDACLMSMVEVAHYIKKYADVMVGSQEVELGTGWNYAYALHPFLSGPLDATQFASHIVGAYKSSYSNMTNDFTQSAIDLKQAHAIEQNVDNVAALLLECIKNQQHNSVTQIVRASGNRKNCTHFDEPSYIDLHHFYCNLQDRIASFRIVHPRRNLAQELSKLLTQGKQIISNVVFANIAGKNLNKARGLSIYFPERYIDSSYQKTTFAQSNRWYNLIATCKL